MFDFDGTLVGGNKWRSLISNTIQCITSDVYVDFSKYDIRWCILTGRPKIDKWLIRLICNIKGLYPEEIITADTFTYQFDNIEDNYKWKASVIKDLLSSKRKLKYLGDIEPTVVYYIDNDLDALSTINGEKDIYNYFAMNTHDWSIGKFINFL